MSRLQVLMVALRLQFGNRCDLCGREDAPLEFAHIDSDGLNGAGRGGLKRAYRIRRNPSNYRLLCKPCHRRYDRQVDAWLKLAGRLNGRWYLGERKRT
jgi:hypothetical protein